MESAAYLRTRAELVARRVLRRGHMRPFNNQSARAALVTQLLSALPISACIETGTYFGETAQELHRMSRTPVYTIEAFPRFAAYNRIKFRRTVGIRVLEGDSADVLDTLGKRPDVPKTGIFFYLDAHSSGIPGVVDVADELPLDRELFVIRRHWDSYLILIDDFRVADDEGYGYDDYGGGRAIDCAYLRRCGVGNAFHAFYPSVPSWMETGAKRGSVILTSSSEWADTLNACGLLRRAQIR